MSLSAALSRCDREIEARLVSLRAGEVDQDPPGGGQFLGLHDWRQERKLIVEEINAKGLNHYAEEVHAANSKWWIDIDTGEPLKRNVGELLMLCTSELAEAMEGHRKGLMDDKLVHRSMFEVELADCLIRIFDIGGGMGLDLDGAYREKMAYNAIREDHKIEARKAEGGKKY